MSSNQEREVNIPLLRKAVEWVEAEAERPFGESEWDQKSWVKAYHEGSELFNPKTNCYEEVSTCGTAYCVAGYVGQLLEPAYRDSTWVWNKDKGGDIHVSNFAQEQLGITPEEGFRLFHADNTAEDIRRIAESIAGEPL